MHPKERNELLDDLAATLDEMAEYERLYKARLLQRKAAKAVDDKADPK